jgi:hypothetical protein
MSIWTYVGVDPETRECILERILANGQTRQRFTILELLLDPRKYEREVSRVENWVQKNSYI